MSLINNNSEKKEIKEKNENDEKNKICSAKDIKRNRNIYSFIYNNKMNIITLEFINNKINLKACIKEIDENNNYNNINYYSKNFKLSDLTNLNEIFKLYNNINDIKQLLNNIFLNKPLISIEESSIKIYIKESITFSFNFELPKIDKKFWENECFNKSIIQSNNNNNNLVIDKIIDFFILGKINLKLDENNQLKKRIMVLEEKQKMLKSIFEELEKEKENKIKILEEQLNKIKEKILKEEHNSHIFFNEKLKFGLIGKSEPIKPFNKPQNILAKINLIEERPNESKNIFSEQKNLILQSENEQPNKKEENAKNTKNFDFIQNKDNIMNQKKSGFFKNIHNSLKNNLNKEIYNQNKELEDENNYLYSNSENDIIDDIQFFNKSNQKLIENKKDIITPNEKEKEKDINNFIGNKRKNENSELNLSYSKKSQEIFYEEILLNSKIVSFFEDYEFLINYIKNTLNLDVIKAMKIYRASEDGDQASKFHSLCDDNTNVIILIKTKDKKKFGGFTSKGFNSSNSNIVDNSAFVFSLDKKQIYPVKKNKNAIYCFSNYGPSFSQILLIPDSFFTNISCTFAKNINFSTYEDYQITNGNKCFHIEELEVFELLIR